MQKKRSFPAKLDLPVAPKKIHWNPQAVAATSNGFSNADAMQRNMLLQLKQKGITDERVLTAMAQVKRHNFIDPALFAQSYSDVSLPIGLKQTISKPSVVAKMLQLITTKLNKSSAKVLEIGSGCGYQAALLAKLFTKVYSIERLEQLHQKAKNNLVNEKITNVKLIYGDGMLGYPNAAPFDAIISAASGLEIPNKWLDQLVIGGILVAPIQIGQQQFLLVLDKISNTQFKKHLLEPVLFVPLQNGVIGI